MAGKTAVYSFVEQHMGPGKTLRQLRHDLAGSTIARIPCHPEFRPPRHPVISRSQGVKIRLIHSNFFHRRFLTFRLFCKIAPRRHFTKTPNVIAEEWLASQHHLESVMIRRVVGASNHDTATSLQMVDSKIEHGCGASPYPFYRHSGLTQPFHYRRLQFQ